ncbi:MAG TPA: glutamine cyclotransferase, partial [Bacteroidales bacterium]|nr:glutamine cyclotransferase [Bacteroidales bacterium]
MKPLFYLLLLFPGFVACSNAGKKPASSNTAATTEVRVEVPIFNADSAWHFVAKQLAFGPRVPGHKAHEACADWMSNKMSNWADTVIVQSFRARA